MLYVSIYGEALRPLLIRRTKGAAYLYLWPMAPVRAPLGPLGALALSLPMFGKGFALPLAFLLGPEGPQCDIVRAGGPYSVEGRKAPI